MAHVEFIIPCFIHIHIIYIQFHAYIHVICFTIFLHWEVVSLPVCL